MAFAFVLRKEVPPVEAYNAVQKDCRTGQWVYRRLFEVEERIDVAFIGTSMTMCDFNDRLLEQRLREERGLDLRVANLGICRIGENLHWLVARDLLEQKQPKLIFLEVPQRLLAASHPHFPYLARSLGDVLRAPMAPNGDYFIDAAEFAWGRWEAQRNALLGGGERYETFLEDSLHSYMEVADDRVAGKEEMEREKARRAGRPEQAPEGGWGALAYAIDQYPPQNYLNRIVRLGREKGTRVVFMYTPYYGVAGKMPRESGYYQERASLAVPPDSVFDDPGNFFDANHLNQVGAGKLTDWLVEEVAKNIAQLE